MYAFSKDGMSLLTLIRNLFLCTLKWCYFPIQILGKFVYSDMGGCGRGVAHQTCLTVMAREPGSSSLCVYVLEAPSSELAHAICTHIGQWTQFLVF